MCILTKKNVTIYNKLLNHLMLMEKIETSTQTRSREEFDFEGLKKYLFDLSTNIRKVLSPVIFLDRFFQR